MERHYCLDCKMVGALNVRGNCGTCNSPAVVSEHAQGLSFPGLQEWLEDAEMVLRRWEMGRALVN